MDRDRYDYVMNQRIADPHYRNSGGTYGWARAAHEACERIMEHVGNIETPILLCQAGKDTMVRLGGQDAFDRACDKVTLIRFPDSKHELFNATDEIREKYFESIIAYFDAYANWKEKKVKQHKETLPVKTWETLFNQKYLMQGICDSSLTSLSREQSRAAGIIFREKGITFDNA